MINTVTCGDCLEIMPSIPDGSIDYTLTSPPYNRKRNDKYLYFRDINKSYFDWNCLIIDNLLRITKGNVFYNMQKNYYNKIDVYKLIGKYADNIQEIIVWEKSNPMPSPGKFITNAYEFIIAFGKPLRSNTTYTKNHITTSVNRMIKEHRAVMKLDIAEFIIKNFTNKNDCIFDPLAGVGTTAIACINLRRNYICIEKEEKYCEIGRQRIKEATRQMRIF